MFIQEYVAKFAERFSKLKGGQKYCCNRDLSNQQKTCKRRFCSDCVRQLEIMDYLNIASVMFASSTKRGSAKRLRCAYTNFKV